MQNICEYSEKHSYCDFACVNQTNIFIVFLQIMPLLSINNNNRLEIPHLNFLQEHLFLNLNVTLLRGGYFTNADKCGCG